MTELKPVFTVSELNEYVDLMLSRDPFMGELNVTGEISAFKRHTSGHLYFTLKDDAASVRCVMFRPNALRLSFFPKDGMSVRIEGRAGLYGRDGSFQVYAERMEKTGDGALYQKFLALRDELKGRGWFDESLKKPIPFLPRAVGVVTSGTGAAIEDIRNVISRRFPNMPIVLYPVAVQGEKAAEEIAAAIRKADEERRCDVLIVGRGGIVTEQRLLQEQQRLDQCKDALEEGIERRFQRQRDALTTVGARLKAADPLGAMDRGFALVYDNKNGIVRRAAETAVGEGLTLRFRDGRVQADVTGKDLYEKE